jgi:hypothetical protein
MNQHDKETQDRLFAEFEARKRREVEEDAAGWQWLWLAGAAFGVVCLIAVWVAG